MGSQLLQFLFAGLTIGAIYALVALGFSIIYNVSGVINFAQGEFVMLGGMTTFSLFNAGMSLWSAALSSIAATTAIGFLIYRFAIQPVGHAPVATLVIMTLAVSMFLSGASLALLGKSQYTYPAFSTTGPIVVQGAALMPQSLWVMGCAAVVVVALAWFFGHTMAGKSVLATAHNKLAAQLVGINTQATLAISFAVSAAVGSVAGVIMTPITMTSYDNGGLLGLKGFAAAALGGLGSAPGAVVGGLLLGLAESMTAGYLSSAYKDAVAFGLIILTFLFMPNGLLGRHSGDRV